VIPRHKYPIDGISVGFSDWLVHDAEERGITVEQVYAQELGTTSRRQYDFLMKDAHEGHHS
jgi:hypothetical protein